jgi:eukaryotic-like serine/threonine-protein kinase
MFSDELREGQILASKYRVERLLGQGGMGVVLAAMHVELEQRVAIKVLKRDLAESESIAERFRREARAACRIKSPHGARVLDVGTTEDGLPYMVMEYLDGHDLAAELEERGRLPIEEAASYVIQAADAICDAHDENIIHRDIKPANLFLTERGGMHAVKVLDFGISKSLQDTTSANPSLTHTQALIGSPMYMSPEQLDSPRTVDARTDIWSLGIVLYELVTGHPPFSADGIAGLIKQIVADAPPRLSDFGVDAPVEFEAIIQRCLAKKRDDRYSSVRELMVALAPFAKESPMSVPVATRAAFRSVAGKPGSQSAQGSSQPGADPSPLPRPTPRLYATRVAGAGTDPSASSAARASSNARTAATGSAAGERTITPYAQSHTHAEPPAKRRTWPLLLGLAGLAAAAAAYLLVDLGKETLAAAAPTAVLDEAPALAATATPPVAATAPSPVVSVPAVTPSPSVVAVDDLANPSPSVGAVPAGSGVEPTAEGSPPLVPKPGRVGKRPAKPPTEATPPAPKPPSGISDFGGRH